MGPERREPGLSGARSSLRAEASGRPAARWLRLSRLGVALLLAWLALMAVGGWVLASSQQSSREAMAGRLQARTRYAATFISIYARDLLIRERSAARGWLAGSRVGRVTLERTASALGLRGAVLLDARGHAITDVSQPLDALLVRRYSALAVPGDAAATRISLFRSAGTVVIGFAVRYPTPSGSRVFAGAYAVNGTVLPTALDHVVTTPSWRAWLLDPTGARVAGLRGPARDDELTFSADVAGTSWRVVIKDSSSELYGFLNGPGRWLAWLALAGLTVAGVAIILLIAGLARQRTQLIVQGDELARLAAVDALTGLRNRRAIEHYLHDALSAARRHELTLSVLLIDVDHFKSFNDRLGHRGGDAVLAQAAQALDGALRAEDAIGRWGGEEFLVVMPGTDEEGAVRATERLRAALAAHQPEEARAHGLPVTVTIGVAQWQQEEMNELISRADHALYGGKAAGRDTASVSTVMAAVTDVPERG